MPPSPDPPTPAPIKARRLQSLLADLGPQIQQGNHPRYRLDASQQDPLAPLATGLPEIDALLEGGFPADGLSEISGPASSGRTSLLLALLARLTRQGAHAALVDRADAFDPPSAEAAGVVLEQVLWVRAPEWRSALRCSERLLETDGFPLVLLDLTRPFEPAAGKRAKRAGEAVPDAAWLRLSRLAADHRSALVLLSSERLAGPRAQVALEMQPAVAHFTGTPSLLEALETQAVLIRRRGGAGGRMARLRSGGRSHAA